MGRQARQLSSSGFYHIVFRGIIISIFLKDESDYNYFLKVLRELKNQLAFDVHAYCLMSNHVHYIPREATWGYIANYETPID